MRLPRTLTAYLAKEVALYTGLGLLAIGVVLVSRNLLRFLDELIAAGLTLPDFATLVGCLVGLLAAHALPVAFLFGVLLAFGRLAADLEITAMRACGLGTRALVAPAAVLGLLVSGLTAYLVLDVEHRAQHELRMLVKTMATRGLMVTPGEFREIDDRVLYVRARESDSRFSGVVISDRSNPERPLVIFAESGRLELDRARGELIFRLEEGDIHVEPEGAGAERSHRISFRSFDYVFEAQEILGAQFASLRPREMSLAQLRGVVARADAGEALDDMRRKDPNQYRMHIHRRFALPFAPLLFALVGAPLAMRRGRSARSRGVLWCGALAASYYALVTASQWATLRGLLPAATASWLPNAGFALAAAWLLWRARRLGH